MWTFFCFLLIHKTTQIPAVAAQGRYLEIAMKDQDLDVLGVIIRECLWLQGGLCELITPTVCAEWAVTEVSWLDMGKDLKWKYNEWYIADGPYNEYFGVHRRPR